MKEAFTIITQCFWDSPRQAIKEILSLLAILACFAILLYAWDIPKPVAGIQSAEHQAEVARRVVRK